MRLSDLLQVSFRNCIRLKGRTVANALIIALGMVVLLLTGGLAKGIKEVTEREILQTRAMREISVIPNYHLPNSPQLDAGALARLKKIKNVSLVYPEISTVVGLVEGDKKRGVVNVEGVPAEALPPLVKGKAYEDGERNVVVIPDKMSLQEGELKGADYLGRELAVEYPLLLAGGRQEWRKDKLRVVGVYEAGKKNLPPNTLLVPPPIALQIKGAQQGLNADDYLRVATFEGATVLAAREEDVQTIAAEIEKMGFATGYVAKELATMPGSLKLLTAVGGTIATIVFLLGAMSIMVTMFQATKNRTWEIGLMKAVGFLARDIRAIFLAEAANVGLLGAVFGIAATFLITAIVRWAVSGKSFLAAFPLKISLSLLFPAVFVCMAVSLLGSIIPAVRASRISASAALRSE